MTYALITGASKGIGKAIAQELAKGKFNLLLVARSEELLRNLAHQLSSEYQVKTDYLSIDIALPDSPEQIFNWCSRNNYQVDMLVNNAGYGLSGPIEKYAISDNVNMMQVNMIAPVKLTQLMLPMLRKQQRAYILNIASTSAYQAIPYMSIYAASKVFMLNFSRALRQELGKTNISVTCISPGATDTNFNIRAEIGERGLKTAEKFNMKAESVAQIAVKAMLARKTEVITGFVNKVGAFFAWLLPKALIERSVMKIYE